MGTGNPLSQAQRERIGTKIRGISEDITYLVRTGIPVPVSGGRVLSDANFQRRRAELLQQVLDTNDVDETTQRAARTFEQANALRRSGDVGQAEERRLEAALLLWAIEEVERL